MTRILTIISLLTLPILVCWLMFANSAKADLLPAGRLPGGVVWASNQVGVVGGIPNVTTIYTNLYPINTADDINTALANCPSNEVVYLNAGTYLINNAPLYFYDSSGGYGHNGTVLRGAGMGQTILQFTNTPWPITIEARQVFGDGPDTNAAVNWLSGYSQGSTNITIDVCSNQIPYCGPISAGNLICLVQENDPNVVNPTGNESTQTSGILFDKWGQLCNQMQFVRVTAVDATGTNLTIWPGVYMTNYQASLHPQIFWTGSGSGFPGPVMMDGVENMTIDLQNNDGIAVAIESGYNCWIRNVEVTNTWYAAVKTIESAHITIEGCYFHDCGSGGASTSYGVNPNASSDVLVENNIFYKVSTPCQLDSGSSGCIFAYNYCTNMIFGQSPGWMAASIQPHGSHPDMNLFEGNIGSSICFDDIHGSSSHNTVFRNRLRGLDIYTNNPPGGTLNNTYVVDVNATNRWISFIGNVLGTDGYHTNYDFAYNFYPTNYGNIQSIYKIGFFGNFYTNGDLMTYTTLTRDGNYDYATHSTKWDDTPQTIPMSLYLTAKPAWWSNSVPYPPIGSDLTPMVSAIPAQLRYNGGGGGGTPAVPTWTILGNFNAQNVNIIGH